MGRGDEVTQYGYWAKAWCWQVQGSWEGSQEMARGSSLPPFPFGTSVVRLVYRNLQGFPEPFSILGNGHPTGCLLPGSWLHCSHEHA